MVDADTQRRPVLPAYLQERQQALLDATQLGGILLIGVVQMLKLACSVHVVAGIDAHLFAMERRHVGHIGIEMHISHQGHGATGPTYAFPDETHVLRLTGALSGQTDKLTSGPGDAQHLRHTALGVHRGGGTHRLHPDRIVSADGHTAHQDGMRTTPREDAGWSTLRHGQFTLFLYFTSESSWLAFTIFTLSPVL